MTPIRPLNILTASLLIAMVIAPAAEAREWRLGTQVVLAARALLGFRRSMAHQPLCRVVKARALWAFLSKLF